MFFMKEKNTPNLMSALKSTEYLPIHQIPSLVFRNENMRGFYKGLAPNLLRVVPATAITFVTYEKVSHFIAELRQQ